MNILALDTSSRAASCALLQDNILSGEFFTNTALTHSQTILPMVQTMLASVQVSMREIDVFAVSTGPGSFTGLRIGISAVKGIAMALDKPSVAVPTLEALAENLTAFHGWILPVMDARRAQVYTATFFCENAAITRKTADTALSIADLKVAVAALAPSPVLLVGDGARLCKEQMPELAHVSVAPENLLHQRAGSTAAVAARLCAQGRICTAAELAPAYLRLPQAERERLAKLRIPGK